MLQKAEELGAVLFIHPQSTPELAERFKGNGWLSNTIGNPLDTTIALQHLIFEGTLDKFPGLKVLAAHGGGYLPSYAMRGDHACFVSPQNCNPDIKLKKKPSEYLNQLYFDAMVFSAEGLRHLVAQVGASQVVLGTDHPIPWETASGRSRDGHADLRRGQDRDPRRQRGEAVRLQGGRGGGRRRQRPTRKRPTRTI